MQGVVLIAIILFMILVFLSLSNTDNTDNNATNTNSIIPVVIPDDLPEISPIRCLENSRNCGFYGSHAQDSTLDECPTEMRQTEGAEPPFLYPAEIPGPAGNQGWGYRDPVATAGIGKESKFFNYSPPDKATKVLAKIVKKARDFKDEMVANHYLEGEILSFFTKLENLKDYCLTGRQARVKEVAKNLDSDEDYIITVAEALRTRKEVSAQAINKMFQGGTKFDKMDIRSLKNIGFIR